MDAFSSDSIPVHLLTREAIQLYFRHLKPEGVLALHISNRYLDLKPVCEGGASAVGRQAWSGGGRRRRSQLSFFFDVGSGEFRPGDVSGNVLQGTPPSLRYLPKKGFRPWTDDYSNLFQILDVK